MRYLVENYTERKNGENMKKTSVMNQEKNHYQIMTVIENIAYIKLVTGKTGLFNVKTNKIIGNVDYYDIIDDVDAKFYYQIKELLDENKKTITIYDALNEKSIVDDWEVVKQFNRDYPLIAIKSPRDGKIHLFDHYAYRQSNNIFDMPLDDVEFFGKDCNDTYFVLTKDDKKGIYHYNSYDEIHSLIIPIEFDCIENFSHIAILTKDHEQYFACDDQHTNFSLSEPFDQITIDEENQKFLYCKKGNVIDVYNTKIFIRPVHQLLLSIDADEIKKIYSEESQPGNFDYQKYIFKIVKDNKVGIIGYEKTDYDTDGILFISLSPTYDDIEMESGAFYLKRKDKIGLFVGNQQCHQLIKPKYQMIQHILYQYFALCHDGLWDIGEISPFQSFTPSISNCELVELWEMGLLYKKNNQYGLVLSKTYDDVTIVPAEYDRIKNVEGCYFILEQNNKKGFRHLGNDLLPVEYDEIKMSGLGYRQSSRRRDILYLALRKGKEYQLAKMKNWEYTETNIELVSNQTFDMIDFFDQIMILKDKRYTYIYDYQEQLLQKLPRNASIMIYENHDQFDCEDDLYLIDGVYYNYLDGKLIKIITINETKDNLMKISSDDSNVQESYSTLVLKK